jgi:competence protein ComEC
MSTVHFLNVGKGDCTLIQHNSGRNTVIDICKGNYEPAKPKTIDEVVAAVLDEADARLKGNFGMSKKPTNPISYFQSIGVESIFRFILTHPDMDHLDGFDVFMDNFALGNFWDAGIKREKPDFSDDGAYKEEDWDRYVQVRDGNEEGVKIISNLAGTRFPYANQKKEKAKGGDGLYILAPDKALLHAANKVGEINDASYVLLYRSAGGRILIPGDAHDETWDYVIEHYKNDVENCSVLFAPHHGRKSGRSFEFLDVVKPKITFFGCATSGHLAYDAWSSRELPVITNNQAGNIVFDCANDQIDIYVQNPAFAEACECDLEKKNGQDYIYYDSISDSPEVVASS